MFTQKNSEYETDQSKVKHFPIEAVLKKFREDIVRFVAECPGCSSVAVAWNFRRVGAFIISSSEMTVVLAGIDCLVFRKTGWFVNA